MPIHDWTRVDAGIFHDFPTTWITEVKRALNRGILPANYYALAEQIAGKVGPDVLTLQATAVEGAESSGDKGGATSVTAAPPAVRFTARTASNTYVAKRRTIVIRHTTGDRVVALIEFLSPGNKSSRSAFQAILNKCVAALSQGYHLLVVDLFPPTARDPDGLHGAIWAEVSGEMFLLPSDTPLTVASYSSGLEKTAYVEPVAVGDTLSDMPLFLEEDVYVSVPLEKTYCAAWESVPRRWQSVLVGTDS